MKKSLVGILLIAATSFAFAQTSYDSKTLVDTNNNSTSTINSTNTNNNVNTTTVNSTNTNVNTNTSTNVNTNINSGHTTSSNVNTNNNTNTNTSTSTNTNNNINTGDMTNRNINDSNIRQKIEQPPPTAVAPPMMSGGNSDLCTTGVSGAVQTQILGISSGGTVRDLNCERLKNAKTLYDMGMKVAAVSTLCQDERVFTAMMNAGTPCPIDGKIGEDAKKLWQENPDRQPKKESITSNESVKSMGIGALLGVLLMLAL